MSPRLVKIRISKGFCCATLALGTGKFGDNTRNSKERMIMKFSGITARRRVAGVAAGCVLGGIAAATIAAPNAVAAPDCSAGGVSNTVSTTLGSARAYLNAHPAANQAVGTAFRSEEHT